MSDDAAHILRVCQDGCDPGAKFYPQQEQPSQQTDDCNSEAMVSVSSSQYQMEISYPPAGSSTPHKNHKAYGDDANGAEDGIANSHEADACADPEDDILSRPIVVGYVFGPKKMSTMGVVMAEASRAQLTISQEQAAVNATNSSRTGISELAAPPFSLAASSSAPATPRRPNAQLTHPPQQLLTRAILSTHEGVTSCSHHVQIANVIRYFRSSCSSVDELSSVGGGGASTGTYTASTTGSSIHSQSHAVYHSNTNTSLSHTNRNSNVHPGNASARSTQSCGDGSAGTGGTTSNTTPHHGRHTTRGPRPVTISVRSWSQSGSARSLLPSPTKSTNSAAAAAAAAATTTIGCTGGSATPIGTSKHAASRPVSQTSYSKHRPYTAQHARHVPIHVSFVPLDPELPLDEQHGGKLDIVLHKLTEDILSLSVLKSQGIYQMRARNLNDEGIDASDDNDCGSDQSPIQHRHTRSMTLAEQAAVARVQRLYDFQRQHPDCHVVDDPHRVETLMSRVAIAERLEAVLRDVTSASGVSVSSPRYTVLTDASNKLPVGDSVSSPNNEQQQHESMQKQIQRAGLVFPVICKPLIAAATKASHAMAVVLKASGLARLGPSSKLPCLVQEYSNHDAILYKVYVLGSHVSVHKRRSLPNLPRYLGDAPATDGCSIGTEEEVYIDYMEFDSQRPYPRRSDFGLLDTNTTSSNKGNNNNNNAKYVLTVEEVQPLVKALKETFGLELFGFDVLISERPLSSSSPESKSTQESEGTHTPAPEKYPRHELLVVDVNYFPSYKEVPQFPSLLAQYVTDRAISSRQRASYGV